MTRPSVLVFAGSDPSGGAGICADIQAITACGAHPLCVVTALTVQDNDRVYAVNPVSAELLREQAQALIAKIAVAAVKIGIVADRANAQAIADIVRQLRLRQPDLPVVVDTVLASGHGDPLAVGNAAQMLAPLIEVATLITPNLPEARALCDGEEEAEKQGAILLGRGCGNVLIKGGHGTEPGLVQNRWFAAGASASWTWPRLSGAFHGSGCTLASAIAALLARAIPLPRALELAQGYCHQALESSYAIAPGQRIPNRSVASIKESA
jgi:hydroxymethylpyrimidine/phosphomethylpyrimidine kinase